jgi:hypothetical protein
VNDGKLKRSKWSRRKGKGGMSFVLLSKRVWNVCLMGKKEEKKKKEKKRNDDQGRRKGVLPSLSKMSITRSRSDWST